MALVVVAYFRVFSFPDADTNPTLNKSFVELMYELELAGDDWRKWDLEHERGGVLGKKANWLGEIVVATEHARRIRPADTEFRSFVDQHPNAQATIYKLKDRQPQANLVKLPENHKFPDTSATTIRFWGIITDIDKDDVYGWKIELEECEYERVE